MFTDMRPVLTKLSIKSLLLAMKLLYTTRLVIEGEEQVLLITLTMALFYSSVPASHDSVTVSQHAQHQDPETEAAEGISAIINLIIYICAFPAVTCQKVLCEKVLVRQ